MKQTIAGPAVILIASGLAPSMQTPSDQAVSVGAHLSFAEIDSNADSLTSFDEPRRDASDAEANIERKGGRKHKEGKGPGRTIQESRYRR